MYSTFERVPVVFYHVETVMPKWTGVTICLMVSFIVSTFEDMKTWLTFFGGYYHK